MHNLKEEERKRRNQNAFSLLLMISMLVAVICIHTGVIDWLTDSNPQLGLPVIGKPPQLYQLGLDEETPGHPISPSAALAQAADRLKAINARTPVSKGTPQTPEQLAVEKEAAVNALLAAKGALALQYASRLTYVAFTLAYVVVCLITLPLGIYVMFNALRIFPPKESSVADAVKDNPGIILTAIGALLAAFLTTRFAFSAADESKDLKQILKQTVQYDLVRPPSELYGLFNAFSMGITVYLAIIAVCVMWHSRLQPYETIGRTQLAPEKYELETEARYMEVQLRQLRLVLYLGTAVLVLRIVQTSVGMDWALAYIRPQTGPFYENVKNLAHSFVLIRALYHSVLLATIYLPTAGVLSERIAKIADRANMHKTAIERKQWLDEHGLNFDYMAQIPHLIAILGPVLATPVNALLSHIGGH